MWWAVTCRPQVSAESHIPPRTEWNETQTRGTPGQLRPSHDHLGDPGRVTSPPWMWVYMQSTEAPTLAFPYIPYSQPWATWSPGNRDVREAGWRLRDNDALQGAGLRGLTLQVHLVQLSTTQVSFSAKNRPSCQQADTFLVFGGPPTSSHRNWLSFDWKMEVV